MKNKLLTLFAVCGLSLPVFSQTSDSISYKNQVGIIGSQKAPIGVIYKRQVKPDAAWRFTESVNYGNFSSPVGLIDEAKGFYELKQNQFYLQTLIGYEWQKKVSNRWTVYYGAEAGFGFGHNSFSYDFDNYRADLYGGSFYDNTSTYQTYILQPMAGVKFDINPRFCVSLESDVNLNYNRNTVKGYETLITAGQTGFEIKQLGSNLTQSFNMNFYPISNIQLVYKF